MIALVPLARSLPGRPAFELSGSLRSQAVSHSAFLARAHARRPSMSFYTIVPGKRYMAKVRSPISLSLAFCVPQLCASRSASHAATVAAAAAAAAAAAYDSCVLSGGMHAPAVAVLRRLFTMVAVSRRGGRRVLHRALTHDRPAGWLSLPVPSR